MSNIKRIPYSSSFTQSKNLRELLTSGVIFAVNRYEYFIENKNIVRTFCGCKPSKTKDIKILLVFIKKRRGTG